MLNYGFPSDARIYIKHNYFNKLKHKPYIQLYTPGLWYNAPVAFALSMKKCGRYLHTCFLRTVK